MSDLDTKLREILQSEFGEAVVIPKLGVKPLAYQDLIAQLKQAFADEGYRRVKPVPGLGETYPTEMTGQEWYERFLDEVIGITDEDMESRVMLGRAYREAAKRAAGLEQ